MNSIFHLLFDSSVTLFTVAGYQVSGLEFFGTLSALICVVLTAMQRISAWPIGIVNNVFFFVLFWQLALYSDMMLQVIFAAQGVVGWVAWRNAKKAIEESIFYEKNSPTWCSNNERALIAFCLMASTVVWGFTTPMLHKYLPILFPLPPSFPFIDAFIMMASIDAMILLAAKKVEAWILWVIVDVVSVIVYFAKHVNFVAAEYVLFFGIAVFGLISWTREANYEK